MNLEANQIEGHEQIEIKKWVVGGLMLVGLLGVVALRIYHHLENLRIYHLDGNTKQDERVYVTREQWLIILSWYKDHQVELGLNQSMGTVTASDTQIEKVPRTHYRYTPPEKRMASTTAGQ